MEEIIRANGNNLAEATNNILSDIRTTPQASSISMPITQLATLGAGVSSLIPVLRTVTHTTSFDAQGLYRLANSSVGDVLKAAKNGNFWGAFKTADGTSKFAQLKAVDSLSATSTFKMPINPATMMMAVALFSIEQQLGKIAEMEKQILSFLEIEKQSEIEADIETLLKIITKYKHNWDNECFVVSNHKLVLDVQRTARKNMLAYQKKVVGILNSKQMIVAQTKVYSTLKNLQKKFKYYRLSLYTFGLASLIEIMLSGNFNEENIHVIKSEIEKLSIDYRELFTQCSSFLEKMSKTTIETQLLEGIGTASNAVGKLIGCIPIVKEGPIDEFFQDNGICLKRNAIGMAKDVIASFAEISNPDTGIFIEKMDDIIQIYNHTTEICFDDTYIYLITA